MEIREAIKDLATLFIGDLVLLTVAGATGLAAGTFMNTINQNQVNLSSITGILNTVLVPISSLVFTIGGFWVILKIIGADRLLSFGE
jgi:hypothetical protein